MIKYDTGRLGLQFVLRFTGSVFPRAVLMALPNAILAWVLHAYAKQEQDADSLMSMNGVNLLWATYTSVLSFLLVFRNNQAYTRFWEGATLINQVRGEWFNAVSTCFAFCNKSEESKQQVQEFQHSLVRLASMLYCSALQQVCNVDNDCFEIIECHGMDRESLDFMHASNDRCEVLLQWIQQLIVDADEKKAIKIAPPLLTRAFQELSQGIVHLNSVRKIVDIPFPFPYAQMIICMLLVHWVTTPLLASQVVDSRPVASVVCFLVTFVLWCLVYIAMEIDQPFGEDPNDLPLHDMQRDFNRSLMTLMHPRAQRAPAYVAAYVAWPIAERSCASACASTLSLTETDGSEEPKFVEMMTRDLTVRSKSLKAQHRESRGTAMSEPSSPRIPHSSRQPSLDKGRRAASDSVTVGVKRVVVEPPPTDWTSPLPHSTGSSSTSAFGCAAGSPGGGRSAGGNLSPADASKHAAADRHECHFDPAAKLGKLCEHETEGSLRPSCATTTPSTQAPETVCSVVPPPGQVDPVV